MGLAAIEEREGVAALERVLDLMGAEEARAAEDEDLERGRLLVVLLVIGAGQRARAEPGAANDRAPRANAAPAAAETWRNSRRVLVMARITRISGRRTTKNRGRTGARRAACARLGPCRLEGRAEAGLDPLPVGPLPQKLPAAATNGRISEPTARCATAPRPAPTRGPLPTTPRRNACTGASAARDCVRAARKIVGHRPRARAARRSSARSQLSRRAGRGSRRRS